MIYAIKVDSKTNRILYADYTKYVPEHLLSEYILVGTLPTGETDKEKDITNYLYINGEYIYDPRPEQPEPEPEPTVWDELDAAYQSGYSEGYQEGVNGAYDE